MESDPSKPDYFLGEPVTFWIRRACTNIRTGEYDPSAIVPYSRYGKTAGRVGWYAVGALIAFDASAGIENDVEAHIILEDCMGMAVNDVPDIATLIASCWDSMPPMLQRGFGSLEEVQELQS